MKNTTPEEVRIATPAFPSPVDETANPNPIPGIGGTTYHDQIKSALRKLTLINIVWVLSGISWLAGEYANYITQLPANWQYYIGGVVITAAAIEKVLRFWWHLKDIGAALTNK